MWKVSNFPKGTQLVGDRAVVHTRQSGRIASVIRQVSQQSQQ